MVIFCSALLMIVIGVLGKIGVFFASIPEPIVGGMYLVMFGIIAAVGIANLQVPRHTYFIFFVLPRIENSPILISDSSFFYGRI